VVLVDGAGKDDLIDARRNLGKRQKDHLRPLQMPPHPPGQAIIPAVDRVALFGEVDGQRRHPHAPHTQQQTGFFLHAMRI